MANEYWKMRGSYKSPLPIARDRELLVDMNNGDVYFGWNGSNVPLSNVAELQTLVNLLLAKKILQIDESFYGKSGHVVSVAGNEAGFVLAPPAKGDKGDTPTIRIGSVATGAPGSDVSITNSGTDVDIVLHISIPRGYDGNMLASIYDTDGDGKVNSAETADAVTWGGITDKPTTVSGYGITDAPTLVDGKIQATHLPSYVDDVLEYANYASLPASGTSGIIYITTDANKSYRWTGSVYAEIVASPGTTDAITEGTTNLWHTATRVLSTVLTGLSTATNSAIAATDTVLAAMGKLQAQINFLNTLTTNVQTDSYTLVLADANKLIEINKATAATLTVPTNASVAFPVGTKIDILQTGAGQVTVGGAGVIINATPGLSLSAQWAAATLVKRATDTWVLIGSLSA